MSSDPPNRRLFSTNSAPCLTTPSNEPSTAPISLDGVPRGQVLEILRGAVAQLRMQHSSPSLSSRVTTPSRPGTPFTPRNDSGSSSPHHRPPFSPSHEPRSPRADRDREKLLPNLFIRRTSGGSSSEVSQPVSSPPPLLRRSVSGRENVGVEISITKASSDRRNSVSNLPSLRLEPPLTDEEVKELVGRLTHEGCYSLIKIVMNQWAISVEIPGIHPLSQSDSIVQRLGDTTVRGKPIPLILGHMSQQNLESLRLKLKVYWDKLVANNPYLADWQV